MTEMTIVAEMKMALKAFNPVKASGIDGFKANICRVAISRDSKLFLMVANKCVPLHGCNVSIGLGRQWFDFDVTDNPMCRQDDVTCRDVRDLRRPCALTVLSKKRLINPTTARFSTSQILETLHIAHNQPTMQISDYGLAFASGLYPDISIGVTVLVESLISVIRVFLNDKLAPDMAVFEANEKVFFITGGATGIGALAVKSFLEQGAKCIVFSDVAQDAGVALEAELREKYGPDKAKFIKCDVTNEEELLSTYDTVVKDNGYVDVVINNAGIMNDSPSVYKKQIDVNVTALVTSTLKAIELMRKDKGGKGGTVINISSIAGIVQAPFLPIYFGTKSFVLQFSNCIGMEPHYSRTGVRVIAVCFGPTDTALLTRAKFGGFDEATDADVAAACHDNSTFQKPEAAVAGVVEAFKRGASGSTWLADNDQPPVDISDDVNEGFSILSRRVAQRNH
ncbi:15-hydroxyprostaglandin dehydrogenase [Eumeta japonica]|uniref:15-hydroxyprostaglandin dehydrogenase n=1 Tax=Eumeta variegata TaxID=151549 RepID=A0A4C1V0E1_EUMVA|nr:15-hydroxyprostaglandin dehydrogenase [Eumeta japonica]